MDFYSIGWKYFLVVGVLGLLLLHDLPPIAYAWAFVASGLMYILKSSD